MPTYPFLKADLGPKCGRIRAMTKSYSSQSGCHDADGSINRCSQPDAKPHRQDQADDTRRDDVLRRMLNTPRKPKAIEATRDLADEATKPEKASRAQIEKRRRV